MNAIFSPVSRNPWEVIISGPVVMEDTLRASDVEGGGRDGFGAYGRSDVILARIS